MARSTGAGVCRLWIMWGTGNSGAIGYAPLFAAKSQPFNRDTSIARRERAGRRVLARSGRWRALPRLWRRRRPRDRRKAALALMCPLPLSPIWRTSLRRGSCRPSRRAGPRTSGHRGAREARKEWQASRQASRCSCCDVLCVPSLGRLFFLKRKKGWTFRTRLSSIVSLVMSADFAIFDEPPTPCSFSEFVPKDLVFSTKANFAFVFSGEGGEFAP